MNRVTDKIKFNWTTISIFVVVLLAFDQFTKVIVKLSMTLGETIYVFGKWFQIKFIENPGAAYGFEISDGEWGKLLLSIIRIIAIGALGYYMNKLINTKAPKGVVLGFSLILAGAVGNLLDSMFYGLIFSESSMWSVATTTAWGEGYTSFLQGKVVDMIHVPLIDTAREGWKWLSSIVGEKRFIFFSPIFNVADTYISVGFLYLIIFQRKYFNSVSSKPKSEDTE